MNIKQSFTLALKSLMSSKLRSFLTMLGIIIGVAAVIIIVSVVNGMTKDVIDRFESMGATTITVSVRGRGSSRTVDVEDMQNLVSDNPEYLESMSPSVTIAGTTIKYGENNLEPTSCIGVNEYYTSIKALDIINGRGICYIDSEERLKNCVIGTYIANKLFGTWNVVGESVKINGSTFNIIGVLEETGDSEEGGADDIVLLPYTTAQHLSNSFTMGNYTFNAVSKDVSDDAQKIIEDYLLDIFANSDAYRVSNMSDMIDSVNDLTSSMALVLAGVAGVSLLVGGIGIMNIMLVSVTERTREIGIRKSLGAAPWDIMSQFVVEAVTTSCLGGFIGVLLGIGGSYAAGMFGMTAVLSIPSMIIAFTVSAVIGIAFGYFPAKKASRLNPIEALRYD